jgi:arylsulfatase A-like enzyme
VLVVLVDALRRDRLGAYGSRRGLTPHLDRFAAGATVFEQAVAQAPWTRPAVATLFTGRGPLGHGVTAIEQRLPEAATTLAERFRAGGYRTAAVSTNFHVSRQSGLHQGFESFHLLPLAPTPRSTQAAMGWLDRQPPAEPWLLYLHALEPHAPYDPPADLRARLAPAAAPEVGDEGWVQRFFRLPRGERERFARPLADLYDAEVATFDRAFGELRAELERRGRWDGTLVVLVADHGEALGEHGVVGHAWNLREEALAIPLLIKLPGQREGARAATLAQQLDLLPTLLSAAGLPPAPGARGVDLFAVPAAERVAVSHLSYRSREGLAATWKRWRLVEPLSRGFGGRRALHDLRADPREQRNVLAAHPVVAGWLLSALRAELLRGRARGEEAELDEEARAGLGALGYL